MKSDDEIMWVEDEDGRRYHLVGRLGSGGQGQVRMAEGGRLAVKLLKKGTSPDERLRLERQLAFVKRLDLRDLPVARPEKLLREPWLGYVMELLSEMEPLGNLAVPPPEAPSVLDWYTQTGSLRRRLRLLARCARVLSQLHGKGLVYADLNPDNVLISRDASYSETWLVDIDNLSYQSSPIFPYLQRLGYSAPEVIAHKSGVNSLSDDFSLAIIVFETLTLVHPFVGDHVEDGDVELMQAAYKGKLPWVGSRDDHSNSAERGIPRVSVLSRRLGELAETAFGAGLHDPLSRPSAAVWAESLDRAADVTLECTNCRGSYYYGCSTCPWCDTPRPPYGILKVRVTSPELGGEESRPIGGMAYPVPSQFALPGRIVTGRLDVQADRPMVSIHAENGRLGVAVVDDQVATMLHPDGRRSEQVTQTIKFYSPRWKLHLGPLDRQHRVIDFEL